MSTEDIIIGQDLYEEGPYEGALVEERDAIDQAVGSRVYIANASPEGCVRRFAGGLEAEPERFDRFYFEPRKVVVDIVPTNEPDRSGAVEDKHVEFKRGWCAEHGFAYLVLTDEQSWDVEAVRAALADDQAVDEPAEPPAAKRRARKPAQRGKVQRPRAA